MGDCLDGVRYGEVFDTPCSGLEIYIVSWLEANHTNSISFQDIDLLVM